jgi:hypothetical protein
MNVRLVSGRAELRAAWGGEIMRLNRVGSRHAVDYVMRPQTYEAAQDWSAIDDETETVRMAVYQPGIDTGAPGAPRVKGAGQSGATLLIDGLTPHYVIRRRQFFHVETSGRLYLYRAKAEVIASAIGEASVTLTTMLRAPHGDNNVVELASPMIEGFATVADDAWAITAADRLVFLKFTIEERG